MTDPSRPPSAADREHAAWHLALELAFEGLVVLDGARVVRANGPFAALVGLEAAQLGGEDLGERLAPRDALAVLAPGRVVAAEVRRADGTPLEVELRRKPLGDGKDLVSMRALDDTRRVSLAVEELAAQVAPFTGQAYFESLVSYLVRVCRLDAAVIWELRHPHDQELHALAGWAFGGRLETTSTPRAGSPCDDVLAHGARVDAQGVRAAFPGCAPLAAWGVEGYIGVPLHDADGRALGVLSLLHTRPLPGIAHIETVLSIAAPRAAAELSHQRATAALKAGEARYRLLAENASDMVALFSPAFDYTYASPSALRATGRAADELIGTAGLAHVHPDDAARVAAAIERARAGAEGAKVAYRYRHKDGHFVWLESHGSAILAPGSGAIAGFQVSTRDLSDRKRAETELMAANEALTRLGAMKDEFLSTISHELRTPLAAIQNAVAVLLKHRAGPLSEVQQRFVAIIRDHGAALQRLVDDMLAYQQLALGDAPTGHAPSDMRTLVEAVAAEEAASFAGRALTLTLALPDVAVPCRIDRAQMAQVLRSLLSNAAKFTPAGGHVAVQVAAGGTDVRLSVKDTGLGIPSDALERVFEKFVQLDGSLTRPVGGAGLGLALCKQIVERHGGRIWAESAPGAGTTVHVALPAGGPDAGMEAT